MTLIITYINRHGIIHASDSNLTSGKNTNAGEGKKTYAINFLNAGLTIAGSYNVSGEPMDKWMPTFIDNQSKITGLDLKTFCYNLKDAIQSSMTKAEKDCGSIIHVAGYVEENGLNHPEFWHTRLYCKCLTKTKIAKKKPLLGASFLLNCLLGNTHHSQPCCKS